MSTIEANKELVRRMNDEVWGAGNLELIDEYVTEDYVEHNNASPEEIRGPAGYKENVEMVRAAFSDLEMTTDHLVAEDDTVVNHWTMTGTHDGPLMGIDPTGAEVTVSGISLIKLEDGRLVEDWAVVDVFGMMQQLGVVEPPGE